MNILEIKANKKVTGIKFSKGQVLKVMDWGVKENPDKSWALSGFERETKLSARV